MSASPFHLITIDLDETVWPCLPVILAAEQAVLDWLIVHAPRLAEAHDVHSLRQHRRELMQARPEIAHDVTAVRQHSLHTLLTEFGYPASMVTPAMAVFGYHRNLITPYPDAAPSLRRLRQQHQLISLTNGNADPEQTPLRGLFHHSLVAADAGAAKPHPKIFEMAMALAGSTPTSTLHIGDEPWLDVEAARQQGLTAIWINRNGQTWPAELAPPSAQFNDLSEIPDWLTRRTPQPPDSGMW
jgi:putative hydrolase of the HAD superfamily